ncbi:hypothetical protein [Halobacteriovorax sp. RZ-2]|uniref:hypothetical protein n=1 Tax=unclassified Halobacteriovorax TaxID=2639665 RepID=UPI003717971D
MKRLTKAKEQNNLRKKGTGSSFKKVKVSVMALTLIHSSIPMSAFAFKKNGESWSEFTSGSGMKTVIGGLNMIGDISQQMYNQGRLSNTEIQALQAFNKSKADAQQKLQSRRMHPAFNCPLAPEPILAPNGACSIGGNLKIPEQALEFGQNILNEYTSFLKPRNTPPYVGSQCIEDGMKSIQDNFASMTSQYDRMIEQFEAELKKVAEIQKKNRIKIKEVHALLNGGGNNVSQDFINTDFNKIMPASCVEAYDVNKIIKKQGGLVGLKDRMSSDDRKAKRFRGSSLITMRNQIESDKKKVAQRLATGGYDEALREDLFKGTQFANLFSSARTFAAQNTTAKLKKVQTMLSSLGVSDADLPKFDDPSFLIKVDRLASKSEDSYKEKFIIDCMTGKNAAAYSTPINQAVNSFDNVKLGNQGDTLSSFKRAASNAFSDPTSLSSLDSVANSFNNNDIRITVSNSSGNSVTKSAKEYYSDIKNECVAIFNGDLKPAGDVAKLETYRAEAKALKAEAKKLQSLTKRTLASEGDGSIMAEIDELIYNCNGNAVELSKCGPDVYETSSKSFCVTQAAACSDNVNTCATFTETLVNAKTAELKQKADTYNAQMQQYEDKAKALMAQMQAHMQKVSDHAYKNMFPNLTPEMARAYGIPASSGLTFGKLQDLDQPMDEAETKGILLEKDPEAFMRDLLAGMNGNSASMRADLNKWFENQNTHLASQVEKINQSLQEERGKWQEFVSNCATAINDRNQAAQKAAKEGAEKAAEASQQQVEFCYKLKGLQDSSPGPGCTGDNNASDLYSDATEIASILQAQSGGQSPLQMAMNGGSSSTLIFEQISEYKKLCASASAEGSIPSDGESKDSTNSGKSLAQLQSACSNSGQNDDQLITSLTTKLTDNLSEEESKYKEDIENFINDDTQIGDDALKAISDKNLIIAQQIQSLKNRASEISGDYEGKGLCKMLSSGRDQYVGKLCDGKADTAKEECITRERKDFEKDKLVALGVAYEAKIITQISSPGLQSEWNRIGEKYSGTACAAINGSQYGQKGFIPGLIEKIDRDLASDGMIQ